jgi:putative aminopeptidase FrvX
MGMEELLKRLVGAPSISGFEQNVRDVMHKELRPHVDGVFVDKVGNLIARKGKGNPKVMLVSHMDEIGFIVKGISKEGFIHFDTVGGWDERIIPAQKVKIYGSKGPVVGVIGTKPPHVMEKEELKLTPKIKDMFIDVGAKKNKEVEKAGISVGDFITNYREFDRLLGTRVTGYGFDNRIGCLALLEVAKALKKVKGTVYFVGSVQEEIGLIGVRGSAFGINPDVMLGIDTTIPGDVPGMSERDSILKISEGPSIEIKDAISIMNSKVKKWLIDTAKKSRIKFQLDVISGGASDASLGAMIREGIPSGSVCVPVRYIHSPIETADLKDIENTVKLVTNAVSNVDKYF